MTKTIEIDVTTFDVAKWWKHGEREYGEIGYWCTFCLCEKVLLPCLK